MKRLKGNTLIEVLTGLALLSIVMVLGLSLFQQLGGIFSAAQQHRQSAYCRSLLYDPVPGTNRIRWQWWDFQTSCQTLSVAPTLFQSQVDLYRGDQLIRSTAPHYVPVTP